MAAAATQLDHWWTCSTNGRIFRPLESSETNKYKWLESVQTQVRGDVSEYELVQTELFWLPSIYRTWCYIVYLCGNHETPGGGLRASSYKRLCHKMVTPSQADPNIRDWPVCLRNGLHKKKLTWTGGVAELNSSCFLKSWELHLLSRRIGCSQ
jgi:hypothetical protein